MNPRKFVNALADIRLESVFNPYADRCSIHDLANGPAVRRSNLRGYLAAIEALGTDTIWMGRDLGYRGGRRTGLALTDERHLSEVSCSYPGTSPGRATRGPPIAERTAAEIWAMVRQIEHPPLLWNVFPFHPHEADQQFSNRRFNARELAIVNDLNHELIAWLGIRQIISIGRDAATYASSFGVEVECVRHPSYGGIREFRAGIQYLYGKELRPPQAWQKVLF
ncbi:uracil-DNA glycosylase [Sideroxydans sp.]